MTTVFALLLRISLIVVMVMLAWHGGNAQGQERSQPYTLANGELLSLQQSVIWNGKVTELAVDFVLGDPSAPTPHRILRQHLVENFFNVAADPGTKLRPKIISTVAEKSDIAILFSATISQLMEEVWYVELRRNEDGTYLKLRELWLMGVLPPDLSVGADSPPQVILEGVSRIRVQFQDGFSARLEFLQNGSLNINGRPCSPAGEPVTQLNFPHFLNALSPDTARIYRLHEPRPIPWWDPSYPAGQDPAMLVKKIGELVSFTPSAPSKDSGTVSSGVKTADVASPATKSERDSEQAKAVEADTVQGEISWWWYGIGGIALLAVIFLILKRRD